jgi:uroporphyrinogen-III decarboxylase
MTSRERILNVLRGKTPDRIPWAPLIDGYYLSSYKKSNNQVDAILDFGGDVFARHIATYAGPVRGASAIRLGSSKTAEVENKNYVDKAMSANGNVEIITVEKDGNITQTMNTSKGSLQCKWVRNEISPFIPFPTEYRLKTVEDIKIYEYVYENLEYEPLYDIFLQEDAYIGDDGLATTSSPSTPFHDLIEMEFGIENFYYMLYDYKTEVEELMEVMHEHKKKIYSIIATSPAEVVIGYENTSTTTTSPEMYEKYCEKQINEYAEILHKSGKLYLTHMCGKLKGLEKPIARGHMDGISDIAPSPTGDTTLGEARKMWGPDKIVMGGIDATAFKSLSPEGISQYVQEILKDIAPGNGVILCSGDATPQWTPFENLQSVTDIINRYGSYPIKIGG